MTRGRFWPLLITLGGIVLALVVGTAHVLLGANVADAAKIAAATMIGSSSVPALLAPGLARAVAVRRSRRRGVLAWGAEALDLAARIDVVVLQKSGTVTTGDLRVVSINPHDQSDDRNMRWFAGALCRELPTPVGTAISRLAAKGRTTEVETIPGTGVLGTVDRHPVRVGAPEWLAIDAPSSVHHVVGVEVDGRPFGTITVGDTVRSEAPNDVRDLRALGLEVVLVSDDLGPRTEAAALSTGIGIWHADLDSHGQSRVVGELLKKGHKVAALSPYDEEGLLAAADLVVCESWPDEPHSNGVAVDSLDVGRLAPLLIEARRAVSRGRQGTRVGTGSAVLLGATAALGFTNPLVSALLLLGSGTLMAVTVLRPDAVPRTATPV